MRCLLFDHEPVKQEGTGKETGAGAEFCRHCGKVFRTWGQSAGLQARIKEAQRSGQELPSYVSF